ncbi:PTS sugar transporter subunit IIA [Halobacillus karajensis]|uniref:Glucose-specific phosphotransferase enzyme IIA component n=1 Tax=Halobacillus karajensis TaxID=195088 RepID=A0A024P5L4_9BACI|nr:PTS glucose transporter subunit IIA [Halobacillus karajensis]CDQ18671.1 Glucose-specific phosphotransferase enzyme IIA component [Halobacillus karajensis]CDQ23257.1 Glucose-specific phosphotransferase enzyme IIA component [Halobacillus karajensis]CDQ26739.1 Glucose-specific phosphotransferase enzyme IIA component [Halobacillus karajensis]
MFKKLFGNKSTAFNVISPLSGKKVALEEVPDPVFSQKMMGEGVALEPKDGYVFSPLEGTIVQLFPTKHAIGLETKSGAEVLIHIGLETVAMEGEGFEAFVSKGDKVKVGDKLISFDLGLVKEKAKSTLTPIIITNSDEFDVQVVEGVELNAVSTPILSVKKK